MSRPTQDTTRYNQHFAYRPFTFFGSTFQLIQLYQLSPYYSPTTPILPKQNRFGLFPLRSPLLRKSLLFSLPTPTQMFQFSALASFRMYSLQLYGLPHSEIHGLQNICFSPWLIAAYHVLRRLSNPRHPLCALSNLLILSYFYYFITSINSNISKNFISL